MDFIPGIKKIQQAEKKLKVLIHEWNYDTFEGDPVMYRGANEPPSIVPCLGIEIEVIPRKLADETRILDKFVDLKEDGTLRNAAGLPDGFEIVSKPATLSVHKELIPWKLFFETVGEKMKVWDDLRCGMHVHISKEALNPIVIGGMMMFINRPENRGFIKEIAGRDIDAVHPEKGIAYAQAD
jgi:hypothetical protein